MEQRKLIKLKGEIREMSCNEVYEQFKKFASNRAYRFRNVNDEIENLIQVANVALVTAFNIYKGESENLFITFLGVVIDHGLLRHLRDNIRKRDKAKTDDKLFYDDYGNITTQIDRLVEPITCEETAISNITNVNLRKFINELKPLNRIIIEMYYFEDMTQAEIGTQINITQVQVSRIIKKSLKILKQNLGR